MKKKILSMALAVLMTMGTAGALTACGGNGGGGSGGSDLPKTQLYVRNYQGGFGNKWLYNGKDKLEAKYKDVELEPNKKGVEVKITDIKETPQAENIKNDDYEVYFVEKVQYLYLEKQGVLEDLTDIVTSVSSYDGKKIEEKLTKEQRDFYGIDKNGTKRYYALPHYFAPLGIVYDIDLFEDRGYYFAKGYENEKTLEDKFVADKDSPRSAGPDGIPSNDDDGLPATYEDFWNLCEYIVKDGYTPLNWGGVEASKYYVTALMFQLAANYQGAEEFMRNFTMDGELSEVVKLDGNGNVVMGANGVPETEKVTLVPSQNNGYETFRTLALYYGLDFVKTLMNKSAVYAIENNVKSQSYDAFQAQKDYVASRFSKNIKRQAMLIEGSWWDSEASSYFEKNEPLGGGKKDCRYGWLPLPNATKEQVGKNKKTLVNNINSLCFVKKGLSDVKKQLALDFVQLMNSDESLVDFTVQTNAFKDLTYDLSSAQVSGLSPFGQNMYKDWKNFDKINPNNSNEQFYNTVYNVDITRRFAISTMDIFPAVKFASSNMTTKEYFAKVYDYTRKSISVWN